MADDAKNPAADKTADKKGQAKDEINPPQEETAKSSTENTAEVESTDAKPAKKSKKSKGASSESTAASEKVKTAAEVAEITEAEVVTDANSAKTEDNNTTEEFISDSVEKNTEAKSKANSKKAAQDQSTYRIDADFQAAVREQIENCKFEIVAALQESVHAEVKNTMQAQIRKSERRRVFGVVVRDILILILIVVAGFFAYRLYDYGEFNFLLPSCEQSNSCDNQSNIIQQPEPEPEVVKDLAWYRKNYGSLFDNIQIKLDADKVSAYYLYSGDYKVDEIASEYLLGMAYNQLNSSYYYSENGLTVPATDLRTAFVDIFGTANYFSKKDFTYDCTNFTYDKANDAFTAPNLSCTNNSTRQILEEITDIYEEGNALYFLTTATIYDQKDNSYYTFDNIFRPVVTNVTEDDFLTHSSLLNKYQYQFKRADDEHFYFSGIIKLK